jgi:hypothetical protein
MSSKTLFAVAFLSGAFGYYPDFGQVVMILQAESGAELDQDAFDLEVKDKEGGVWEMLENSGHTVGLKWIHESVWFVTLMDCDLGFFDPESLHSQYVSNPFDARVLPMSPE